MGASGVPVDGVCCVTGCLNPVRECGMCASHYARFKRTGDARRRRMSRACLACGRFFETERRDKKFCSATCRKRFQRLCERNGSGCVPSRRPNPLKSVLWEPRRNARVSKLSDGPSEFWSADDEWASCSHVCPVCGGCLDRSVDVLSDLFPQGVWIVPPEKGGAMRLGNRCLVHRRCVSGFSGGMVARKGRLRGDDCGEEGSGSAGVGAS